MPVQCTPETVGDHVYVMCVIAAGRTPRGIGWGWVALGAGVPCAYLALGPDRDIPALPSPGCAPPQLLFSFF